MLRSLLFLLLLLTSQSCTQHPGYTKHSDSLYFQRVQLGDGIVYHPDSCFLDYSVRFHPMDSSNKSITNTIKFAQIPRNLLADSILKDLQKGEMISFICKDSDQYLKELCQYESYKNGIEYQIDFKVDEVYNLYHQEEDPNVQEYKSINHFLALISSPNLYKYYKGIWIKQLDNAPADSEKVSDEIVLSYQGYSLLGDSLDIPDYPMQFNTLDQYQVIEGIELALQTMQFGDSVMCIIPSYLAFGELGSKNGNVPPYTALLYYLKAYPADKYYKQALGN